MTDIGRCFKCKAQREMLNVTFEEKNTSRGLKRFKKGTCKTCGGVVVVLTKREA